MHSINRLTVLLLVQAAVLMGRPHAGSDQEPGMESGDIGPSYTLADCIGMALNHQAKQRISEEALKAAEALKKQAASAYWPRLDASALYSITDEDPTFIFPESTVQLPETFSQIMSALLGMNFDLPPMPVPEQRVRLMDNRNLAASVELTLPLFTGGIRSSLNRQADLGVEIARNEVRRTRNEIIRDVRKTYYAVILTDHLRAIGRDTYERLNATLDLTESLYMNGSGRVQKTDYLKNKLIVDNIQALLVELEKNGNLARSALKFYVGLPWNAPIRTAEDRVPYEPLNEGLEATIQQLLYENTDLKKVRLAMDIFDQKVKESRGYLFPHIGLMGRYSRLFNDYDYGMMTPENKEIWMAGVGVQYALFNGFRNRNKVRENEHRANRMRHQYALFKNGLTLLAQSRFYELTAARRNVEIARDVYATASENLDLVRRAYQIEISTERDLIEAQIIEALMKARLEKSLYDHFQIRADLEYLVAERVTDFTGGNPDE